MRLIINFTLLLFISLNANAQHSDVWLVKPDNTVAVSPQNLETAEDVLIDETTGYFLFQGDFSDLGQGPFGTDDPGYQALADTFDAGAILEYVASGQLSFWDGFQWTVVPDSERLHLIDVLGTDTVWDSLGVTNPQGAIDQVLSDGSIHSHIDFSIENSAGVGDPAVGAYLIELAIVARDGVGGPVVHNQSDPFRIAFNNQLTPPEFSSAISALTGDSGMPDSDGDGLVDTLDNCSAVANPLQQDTNGDGYGNHCDPDFNGNGVVDPADFSLLKSRFGQSGFPDQDLNGNGIVDPFDFSLLKSMFGQPPGPSGLAP